MGVWSLFCYVAHFQYCFYWVILKRGGAESLMKLKGYFATLDAKVKLTPTNGQCQKDIKLRIILTALAGGKLFKLYF